MQLSQKLNEYPLVMVNILDIKNTQVTITSEMQLRLKLNLYPLKTAEFVPPAT